jgi:hypothetical protein
MASKEWREKNKKKLAAKTKAWREKNPEHYRDIQRKCLDKRGQREISKAMSAGLIGCDIYCAYQRGAVSGYEHDPDWEIKQELQRSRHVLTNRITSDSDYALVEEKLEDFVKFKNEPIVPRHKKGRGWRVSDDWRINEAEKERRHGIRNSGYVKWERLRQEDKEKWDYDEYYKTRTEENIAKAKEWEEDYYKAYHKHDDPPIIYKPRAHPFCKYLGVDLGIDERYELCMRCAFLHRYPTAYLNDPALPEFLLVCKYYSELEAV